ncbi:Protein of unknown function [Cotesia congregata]|uniref:Uncharacterized protein n=1 Tax=Cotesia congregata TaxID=51543 RepID=A0A8J2HAV5_COTCN|nr:Protein of unknown function [Cotesia congregata]
MKCPVKLCAVGNITRNTYRITKWISTHNHEVHEDDTQESIDTEETVDSEETVNTEETVVSEDEYLETIVGNFIVKDDGELIADRAHP